MTRRLNILLLKGLMPFGISGIIAISSAAPPSTDEAADPRVDVIPVTQDLIEAATAGGDTITKVIQAARPTIGVDYEWGGSNLDEGVDCSNYTWLLFQKTGLPYERYLDTKALSKLREGYGLRQVPYDEAAPGDLLVYGYWDETNAWHGHVVILVDKDGSITGHKGLVLGAHGPPVDQVQFITFTGFDEGFYKTPEKRLRNVLRVQTLSTNSPNHPSTQPVEEHN